MQQQYAVEVYGPAKPTWLGLPSDEDSGARPALTTDPVMAVRYSHMTAASAACARSSVKWPSLAFTASPVEPLCECDSCGHTTTVSGLDVSKNLHLRLEFPIDHPDCIVPAGDCPECGAFAYPKEVPLTYECEDCGADCATTTAIPTAAPLTHNDLPFRLEPCQDDQGDSTVIMSADNFQVAVIPSAVWNPSATLAHPQDQENAKLLLAAVNSFYPARDALADLLDMVKLQRRAAQLRDPDLLWQYNEGIDAAIERATTQLNAMGAEDTDPDE